MKRFIIILILIPILFLCGCQEQSLEDKNLLDGRCDNCGGNWHFVEAKSFLNEVKYYYTCDKCGRTIYTPTWFDIKE